MIVIRTSDEFAAARHQLGLSVSQCARIVKVEDRTLRRWEDDADRGPHPSACRILELILNGRLKIKDFSATTTEPTQ